MCIRDSINAEYMGMLSAILCEDTKSIMEQMVAKYTAEIKLLTQKLKAAESDSLNKRSENLKEQEMYGQKVREMEEALMKYKTSEIIIEERNRALTAEAERQETKHREEIKEYKQRIQELEESLKATQEKYEKQLSTHKEEYVKKDVEVSKTSALQEQQLRFLHEKVNDSQAIIASKDKEINALADRLKYLETELQNEKNHKSNGAVKSEDSKALEVENAVLKKQLEMVQIQIIENKSSYSSIIESMNKNLVEVLQEKTSLTLSNKELVLAAENSQSQCAILEAKVHKLRKYREVVHAAKYVECKGCLGSYTSGAFLAHVKTCQRLAARKENLPTERGLTTLRNSNFEQVLFTVNLVGI
eukprot:TRINITY_DN11458_c0_g3_i1.p1 TRINITY_DN11458_c0_g3~~TRINITY_DN11458_c0_g3_i1.p1  ORF type:complete len:359 (+),score=97.70 TRINITY_DN11458_c0_g3_i1:63-1139(+)